MTISVWLLILILTIVSIGYAVYKSLFNDFNIVYKTVFLWGLFWLGIAVGKLI